MRLMGLALIGLVVAGCDGLVEVSEQCGEDLPPCGEGLHCYRGRCTYNEDGGVADGAGGAPPPLPSGDAVVPDAHASDAAPQDSATPDAAVPDMRAPVVVDAGRNPQCTSSGECAIDERCEGGRCVSTAPPLDAGRPEPDMGGEPDTCVMVRAECTLWASASSDVNVQGEPVDDLVAIQDGVFCFDPVTQSALVNVQTDRLDERGERIWGLSVTQMDAQRRWCAEEDSPHLRVETSCFLQGHAPADLGFIQNCGSSRTMNWFRPADNLPD